MNRCVLRLMAIVMAVLFAVSSAALAEPAADFSHITVANATKVSGSFFTTQFGNNTSDIDVRYMLHGYNPVVWVDQINFAADPMVTEGIAVRDDAEGNRTYTVKLQRDLTWNDGTPLTAADYVFSYLMLASDEFADLGADTGAWKHVVGYEAYAAGETDILNGVSLIDDYTFAVTVKSEYEPYFYELSYLFNYPYPISVIAPGCMVKDEGEGAMICNADGTSEPALYTTELLANTILGEEGYLTHPWLTAGPYRLVGYDPIAGTVDFEINEWYKGNWEGQKPSIQHVTLSWVQSKDSVSELQAGNVQIVNKAVDLSVMTEGFNLLDDGFMFQSYPRIGYGFLAMATEQGPQQFQAVRQALACCIDSDRFVEDMLGSFGMSCYGYYGIGQWMYHAASGTLRPENASEDELAAWDACNLNGVERYPVDYDRALSLLVQDGWTLNSAGEAFDPEVDAVRFKRLEDGTLMKLSFHFARCVETPFAQRAVEMLQTAFAQLNAELVVSDVSFTEMLSDYYREDGQRSFDLNFMATNFVSTFDPMMTFTSAADFDGAMNTSGFHDDELSALAEDMHNTAPGDTLSYLGKWVAFQERYSQVLPTIPIYTNVYADFFVNGLSNYNPNSEANWPLALLYASYGPAVESAEDLSEEVFE